MGGCLALYPSPGLCTLHSPAAENRTGVLVDIPMSRLKRHNGTIIGINYGVINSGLLEEPNAPRWARLLSALESNDWFAGGRTPKRAKIFDGWNGGLGRDNGREFQRSTNSGPPGCPNSINGVSLLINIKKATTYRRPLGTNESIGCFPSTCSAHLTVDIACSPFLGASTFPPRGDATSIALGARYSSPLSVAEELDLTNIGPISAFRAREPKGRGPPLLSPCMGHVGLALHGVVPSPVFHPGRKEIGRSNVLPPRWDTSELNLGGGQV